MKHLVTAMALLAFSFTASAEIEKVATTTEAGIRFMWWPKVNPPKGWHIDEGSSRHFAFRAIAPDGNTFSKAETVIYARADYKPRRPEIKSLSSLIEQDISGFKRAEPGLVVAREEPISSGGKSPLQVVRFSPSARGNWELVAYGEEGDYYLTFTVSSRTKQGLARALPAFKAMLARYRAGP